MTDFLFFLPRPQHPQYLVKGLHLNWRLGWLKGWAVRPIWKMREALGGSRIQVGARFCLLGRMTARGPGRVTLGDDCIVADHCTPFTHTKEAEIKVGSRTFLNGTRFGASLRIEVGDDVILADVRIFDNDFHSLGKKRNHRDASPPLMASVKISNNVWIAAGAAILRGVEIGQDSVVGFGSVVSKSIPAGKIAVGNPAAVVGDVPE